MEVQGSSASMGTRWTVQVGVAVLVLIVHMCDDLGRGISRILRLSTPFSLFSDKVGGYKQRHDPFFGGVSVR